MFIFSTFVWVMRVIFKNSFSLKKTASSGCFMNESFSFLPPREYHHFFNAFFSLNYFCFFQVLFFFYLGTKMPVIISVFWGKSLSIDGLNQSRLNKDPDASLDFCQKAIFVGIFFRSFNFSKGKYTSIFLESEIVKGI